MVYGEILTSEANTMTRRLDERKVVVWTERLARFQASGATVGRFCQNEKVSVNRFYYWAKRVAQGSTSTASVPAARANEPIAKRERVVRPMAVAKPTMIDHARPSQRAAMVNVQFGDRLQLSIPADCLDVIRCVLQSASQGPASKSGDSFHPVVVGAR